MDAQNRVPLSAAGVQLGSDSVFQVQVFSANYGPEYGRGNGGVLNSITRSGSMSFMAHFSNICEIANSTHETFLTEAQILLLSNATSLDLL